MEKDFKYDFFISYKHGEEDSAIAGYIQKKLEHYKIPREIQKKSGKKKITRVFRDKEELSITLNLTEEIENQLKNTEYLIVICSPESRESIWVKREVETFIRYRGIDYVLPVLIKGEPADSFPEAIVDKEILAADVRGRNLRESKKRCKYELLRLIAPTLCCSYDELRQRNRNYMFQRIAIAAVGMAFVGTGFAIYAFHQAKQIDEEYQNSRRNQSRYLSQISGQLLEQGDRMGALKTALAILPEEDSDEALVTEQEEALNNALYSYTDNSTVYFRASRMEKTEGSFVGSLDTTLKGEFGRGGVYYVTVDDKGIAYFFDGESGKCTWNLDSTKLTGRIGQQIYAYIAIDEDRVAFRLDEEIWIVSYRKKEIIKKISLDGKYLGNTNDCFAVDGNFLVFSDFNNQQLTVYNIETGEKKYSIKYEKLGIEYEVIDKVNKIIWDSEREEIILSASCNVYNKVGLVWYSFKEDKYKVLSKEGTEEIILLDDTYLAAIQYTDYKQNELSFTSESTYQFCIFNYRNGECIWKEGGFKANGKDERADCMVFQVKDQKRVLIFYLQNMMYLLDADKGGIITKRNYSAQIVGVAKYDEKRLIVGLEDGTIQLGTFEEMNVYSSNANASQYQVGQVIGEIGGFSYNPVTGTVVQQYYSEGKIVFSKQLMDENAAMIPAGEEIYRVYYDTVEQNGEKKTYRCIRYIDNANEEKERLSIYEAGTSEAKYEIETEKAENHFENIKIGMQQDRLLLCYTCKTVSDGEESGGNELHIVDLEKGEERKSGKLETRYMNQVKVLYTSDLSKAFVTNIDLKTPIGEIDLTAPQLSVDTDLNYNERNTYDTVLLTADDRYLIIGASEYEEGYSKDSNYYYYIRIWDIEEGDWIKIDNEGKRIKTMSNKNIVVGNDKPLIAVQREDGKIDFFDISSGSKINTITLSHKIQSQYTYSYSFFDQDEYYIVREEDKISIWNIKEGKKIMEQEGAVNCNIYTDGSSKYFSLQNNGGKNISWNKNEVSWSPLIIYKVDEEHRFTKYKELSFAWASFEGNEILWQRYYSNNVYYAKFHSFGELRKKAEEILEGEVLSEEEKSKYFINSR